MKELERLLNGVGAIIFGVLLMLFVLAEIFAPFLLAILLVVILLTLRGC